MSNEVQITLIEGMKETTFCHRQGEKLLDALVSQGGCVLASCGGRGVCGRCVVQFLAHAPLPSHADRAFFTPKQLREGYRLACTAKPMADCRLKLCFAKPQPVQTVFTKEDGAKEAKKADSGAAFAVADIGTTTVAMKLLDAYTGETLAFHAVLNPQRNYGADVISRIAAANAGMRDTLCRLIRSALEEGLAALAQRAKEGGVPVEIQKLILCANTAMGYLFMGYDTASLGAYPFTLTAKGWTRTEFAGIRTLLLPSVSAFIGGDIVSGIYGCGMAEREEISLLIDLGTNAEMALGCKNRILCASAAAGPAFEGGAAAGIFGADMIKITADMLRMGIVDESGLLAEPYFSTGYEAQCDLADGGRVLVRQQDIRTLQEAKAALYTGIHILAKEYGISLCQIDRIYLAGGFGVYLNLEDACRVGLFPETLQNKITVVSNIALQGICQAAMQEDAARRAIGHILAVSQEILPAKAPDFAARYIDALSFGAFLPDAGI